MQPRSVPDRRPAPPPGPVFPEAGARADLAECRALLATGSRSFHAASMLLPARIRAPASALYAFCRLADDAVDLSADPAAGLARLGERLDAVYSGRPENHPVDRAFAVVVADFALPRALPDALLEGFAWDAAGRRYDALADLEAYAVRVAGTVGMMMAVLMGRREPAVLARACDFGAAMQLTNIARDVGEDARAGRVYLPLADLAAAGVDVGRFLARPEPSGALAGVVGRLLDAADVLYARGAAGVAALPADCRPAIRAAGLIYAEIGREIRRNGCDSVTRRAFVAGRRKLALAGLALVPSGRGPAAGFALPPLASAAHLVAHTSVASALPLEASAPRCPEERVGWVVELFHRLEAEKMARRDASRDLRRAGREA